MQDATRNTAWWQRIRTGLASCAAVAVVGALALPEASAGPLRAEAERARRAGETDDAAASRLNDEGKILVRERKFYEALRKFELALELFPLSNAIFNVGSMHYTLKQYADAFPYLEQTLKAPLAPEQLEIVRSYRAKCLESLAATHKDILVQTDPPGAIITVNGKEQPFPAPIRVLVPFGAADVQASYPGFETTQVVVQSQPSQPPKDVAIRLKREEPMANVTIRCPHGADVFLDGTMAGFGDVRARVAAGEHTVRCGKTPRNAAFERSFSVKAGQANVFDFSSEKE